MINLLTTEPASATRLTPERRLVLLERDVSDGYLSAADVLDRAKAIILDLIEDAGRQKGIVDGLMDRVAAQSELLARRAVKSA